jgi:molecular chaperone HscB
LKGLLEEEEKYQLPPDFLMEMMELNEQMMDAKMGDDAETTAKLKQTIAGVEDEIYQPVKSIVAGYEEGKTTNEDLLKVKEYYYKKKYLSRILATLQS